MRGIAHRIVQESRGSG